MAFLPVRKKPNYMPEKAKSMKRLNANKDIYWSYKWKKFRNRFIQENPLCLHCKSEGIICEATVADHILPINQGGEAYDVSNLQPLCKKHHDLKSAKEAHHDKD